MKGRVVAFRGVAGLMLSVGLVILATLSAVAYGQSDPGEPNAGQIVFTSEHDGSNLVRLTDSVSDDFYADGGNLPAVPTGTGWGVEAGFLVSSLAVR
jgi:hypothetical protein